jgi:Flp pilus assembly pilin Flp
MKLFNLIKKFRSDESGAVTVDWVVLTAAIVGLGIAVVVAVGPGLQTLAGNISSTVSGIEVTTGAGGGADPVVEDEPVLPPT